MLCVAILESLHFVWGEEWEPHQKKPPDRQSSVFSSAFRELSRAIGALNHRVIKRTVPNLTILFKDMLPCSTVLVRVTVPV